MNPGKGRGTCRSYPVRIQKADQFSQSSVRIIHSESFCPGQVVIVQSGLALKPLFEKKFWEDCDTKSQPSSFGCILNPEFCHLGLLEWGFKSSFPVQMQNLSVLRANNGISAVIMSSTGITCVECACCALLCLYDSCVNAHIDTY